MNYKLLEMTCESSYSFVFNQMAMKCKVELLSIALSAPIKLFFTAEVIVDGPQPGLLSDSVYFRELGVMDFEYSDLTGLAVRSAERASSS